MSIGKLCQCKVISIEESATAKEAADLMAASKIGYLLVIGSDKENSPAGILTDRDIALKIVADNRSAETVVKEIMSTDLLILKPEQGVKEVLEQMQEKAVRRAPIIENREIIGLVSLDDILMLLAEELGVLANLVRKQLIT